MPNWIEQHLHVVGSTADVDRFVRAGSVLVRREARFKARYRTAMPLRVDNESKRTRGTQ